ncbi:MAG: hypothetical protein J2P18_18545 [Nocardia sp.]|nr:hypothetical protein [Nocardia sp.]
MRHLIRAAAFLVLAVSSTVTMAPSALADTGRSGVVAAEQPAAPSTGPAQPNPAAPVDPGKEYLNAFDGIAGAWANEAVVGQVVGGAAGAAVGCPLGAVTGGTLTMPTVALTPVGVVGGCILGASALGFLGGLGGGMITGGPAAADAAGHQYANLHSKGLVARQMPVGAR